MLAEGRCLRWRIPLVPHDWCDKIRRRRLSFAIVVATSIFILIICGIQMARLSNLRKATTFHFRDVAASVVTYNENFGHLPWLVRRESAGRPMEIGSPNGTGRPLYSWRVEIVPFLMSWHGSWDPSQPWDSQANKQLVELSAFYAYDGSKLEAAPRSFPETDVLAITGPGTAFGDGKEVPKALKDVSPSTILIVESRASEIPWPAPGDLDIRTMPHTINAPDGKGISSRHSGGFHVIFADGKVWFLSDKVPFETIRKFFTVADAKKNDREKLLGPYALDR